MFIATEKIELNKNSKSYEILQVISNYVLNHKNFIDEASSTIYKENEYYTSDEYLFSNCLNLPPDKFSFAEHESLVNLRNKDLILDKQISVLKHYLQVNNLTLAALYPKNQSISWHHNSNAPGYNILFSYSLDGNGFFKFYDQDNKKIVTIPDSKGWSAKLNYFGDYSIKEKPFWHCAKTSNYRISIGFHINKNQIDSLKSLLT